MRAKSHWRTAFAHTVLPHVLDALLDRLLVKPDLYLAAPPQVNQRSHPALAKEAGRPDQLPLPHLEPHHLPLLLVAGVCGVR
jgi:hypothetical protein